MAVFRQPPRFSGSQASFILVKEWFCHVVMQPARQRRMIYETAGQANIPRYLGRKEKATDSATATGRTEKNHNQPGDLAGPQIRKTENYKKFRERKKRDGKEE